MVRQGSRLGSRTGTKLSPSPPVVPSTLIGSADKECNSGPTGFAVLVRRFRAAMFLMRFTTLAIASSFVKASFLERKERTQIGPSEARNSLSHSGAALNKRTTILSQGILRP